MMLCRALLLLTMLTAPLLVCAEPKEVDWLDLLPAED